MNTGKIERLFEKMMDKPVIFLALVGVIVFIALLVIWFKRSGRLS